MIHFATHELPASVVLWCVINAATAAVKLSKTTEVRPATRKMAAFVDMVTTIFWIFSLVWMLCCIFYTLYLWSVG
jgi:hypothetical protein